MTKKHFQALADVLLAGKPIPANYTSKLDLAEATATWRRMVSETVAMLRQTNPRFDAGRFRDACGADA